MANQQTLLDSWIPQAKRSRSDTPSASEVLALSGERESQTSSSSDLGDARALEDSTELSADTPTFEADRSSSIDCGADTPTSVECGAECCKDGNAGKPFQARNQSIIL